MFDLTKMKTIMSIFGPLFGVFASIGKLLKAPPTTDSSESHNSSGVQVRQGHNGRIQIDNSPITINSAPEPRWVPEPKWVVKCPSGGGARGNLSCGFEVQNIGGAAFDVAVEELGCKFKQEFPPVGVRGTLKFSLTFAMALPHELTFLISARDSNGKPVRARAVGTKVGVRYVFQPSDVVSST